MCRAWQSEAASNMQLRTDFPAPPFILYPAFSADGSRDPAPYLCTPAFPFPLSDLLFSKQLITTSKAAYCTAHLRDARTAPSAPGRRRQLCPFCSLPRPTGRTVPDTKLVPQTVPSDCFRYSLESEKNGPRLCWD